MKIVGCARDAAYRNVREPLRPTVYVPLGAGRNRAFLVRRDPSATSPASSQGLRYTSNPCAPFVGQPARCQRNLPAKVFSIRRTATRASLSWGAAEARLR